MPRISIVVSEANTSRHTDWEFAFAFPTRLQRPGSDDTLRAGIVAFEYHDFTVGTRRAVAQFGKDNKYFGVAIIMATLPGLPMFGHGQVEGFTEKYGMEYRRASWDEKPDSNLVARHEREIFPLLRSRYLFAEVENFFLYDVFAPEGHVVEDVVQERKRCCDRGRSFRIIARCEPDRLDKRSDQIRGGARRAIAATWAAQPADPRNCC